MRIKLIDKNCWPSRAHPTDAGLDLKCRNESFLLNKGEKTLVGTGVCAEIPVGFVGLVVIRSGTGTKTRLKVSNGTGVIDSDYRGEIMVMLENSGEDAEPIEQYKPFCQMLIVPVRIEEIEVVDRLSETKRGSNGFGSSTVQAPKVPNPVVEGSLLRKPVTVDARKTAVKK